MKSSFNKFVFAAVQYLGGTKSDLRFVDIEPHLRLDRHDSTSKNLKASRVEFDFAIEKDGKEKVVKVVILPNTDIDTVSWKLLYMSYGLLPYENICSDQFTEEHRKALIHNAKNVCHNNELEVKEIEYFRKK